MSTSKQFIIYGSGILLLSTGISLTILSDLGTSPFDALLVGLAQSIGLTVGSWEIILSLLMLLMIILISKRKPIFAGLITAIITGIGIDISLFVLKNLLHITQWLHPIITFFLGLILIGLGTAVYLHTRIAPSPMDHLMLIACKVTNKSIRYIKTLMYALFLMLALLFNGPVGLGTLLTVILGGPILQYCMPLAKKLTYKSSIDHTHTN